MPTQPKGTEIVRGQASWPLHSKRIKAWVTVRGGHLGPVSFRAGGRTIEPFSVAPWAEEGLPAGSPPLLAALRGDFFCLPFGSDAGPTRQERHPVHGETANATWKLEERSAETLHASLRTRVRPGRVDKFIRLGAEDSCIYQRHDIAGMTGRMNLGHHLMLRFRSPGRISTSRFVYGQVLPAAFEDPAAGGYQSLRVGAKFQRLTQVPAATGGTADLSRYPARRGFEDLVMVVADARLPFAWTAASFPDEGFVCFTLKDPRVLRSTVFWLSNGGRHYAPWNGRHVDVLGMEEVTSYFHLGLARSVAPNPLSRRGYPTSVRLNPASPLAVKVITGVAVMKRGFGRVASITAAPGGRAVHLRDDAGRIATAAVDLSFLA